MKFVFLLLPTLAYSQSRIIAHIPSSTGGYKSSIILDNPYGQFEELQLISYDKQGMEIGGMRFVVAPFTTITEEISAGDFGDQVSHLGVNQDSNILVTVSYESLADGSPVYIGVSLPASRLWRFFPGNWDYVFDGLAVVNQGTSSARIMIKQYKFPSNELVQEAMVDEALAPMAKALMVVGGPYDDLFSAHDDDYFVVESDQPVSMVSIQGIPPDTSPNYLWLNHVYPFVDNSPQLDTPSIIAVFDAYKTQVLDRNFEGAIALFRNAQAQISQLYRMGGTVGRDTGSAFNRLQGYVSGPEDLDIRVVDPNFEFSQTMVMALGSYETFVDGSLRYQGKNLWCFNYHEQDWRVTSIAAVDEGTPMTIAEVAESSQILGQLVESYCLGLGQANNDLASYFVNGNLTLLFGAKDHGIYGAHADGISVDDLESQLHSSRSIKFSVPVWHVDRHRRAVLKHHYQVMEGEVAIDQGTEMWAFISIAPNVWKIISLMWE